MEAEAISIIALPVKPDKLWIKGLSWSAFLREYKGTVPYREPSWELPIWLFYNDFTRRALAFAVATKGKKLE